MCKYCDENIEQIILKDNFVSRCSWGWGGETKIKESESIDLKVGIFIDRGYLRMVDLNDCSCLDHGEKIEIKYCPICGNELT